LRITLNVAVERADARLQLLMVSTRAPVEPQSVEVQGLQHGLREPHAWDLLFAMDPADLLGLGAYMGYASELTSLSDGHPRVLELMAAVLYGDPELTLSDLIAQLRANGRTGASLSPFVFTRALEGLDRTQQRVLQAMAVISRPVKPADLDAVLDPYLPGQLNAPTLAELARRRLIRTDGQHYMLPRDRDAADLLDGLQEGVGSDRSHTPPPLNRRTLCHLAAEYLAKLSPSLSTPDDVSRRIFEVELRVASGERSKALEVMDHLDTTYLRPRGASSALLQLRKKITLGDDYLDIHNLASRAEARLQQDDTRAAIRELYDALDICIRKRRRRSACKVRIQLGNAFLRAGNCVVAAKLYETALADAEEKQYRVEAGQALAGLMRCRCEQAWFGAAQNLFARAVDVLAPTSDPAAQRTHTTLLLTMGTVQSYLGDALKARRILHRGEREAEELSEMVLAGGFIGARAVLCMDVGQPEIAIRLADQAVHLGAETNNLPLCREAATTLAQAHLCMGMDTEHVQAARAAADHAVRLSQSRRAVGAFAAQGIAALRGRDYPAADHAFTAAYNRAEQLCRVDRRNFEMHDLLGLVSCGLGLRGQRDHFDEAVGAFERARKVTSRQTIVLRAQRLLTQLVGTPDERTERVLTAAAGPYPDSYA
jgi:tetratricopeptide (TPR) repeat protein